MTTDSKRPPEPRSHLPFADEARLLGEVVDFFIHRVPHALGATARHLDEAALSAELFRRLSAMDDADLAAAGIHRDDIATVAASLAGLVKVAHKADDVRP